MINRKIVWLSTLTFTIILAGCSAAKNDVRMTENETHHTYSHDVNKISNFVLENDTDELKIDDDSAAPATLEFNPVSIVNGEAVHANRKVEGFLQNLTSANSAVGEIWDDDFHSLYATFIHHSYIIKDENLTLTEGQTDEVATQIEGLHNQYADLEKDLKDLEVPKVVAENNMAAVETVIDEISRAVENRTLALIEFKSIYEEDEYGKHEELLAIHVENSDNYITKADESINDLINAVGEE